MKILVVDDEAAIRSLVRVTVEFEQPGAIVLEARDGEEGIDIARREQPDLVILDCVMPGLCGADAAPLIREAAPGARVVLFSALDELRLNEMAERAGAPIYTKTDVTEMIEELLAEGRVAG